MKGLTIMTEESSGRRIAQLDLTLLSKSKTSLEDVFDLLIAESRKDEQEFSWEEIRKDLKSKGRI
jgi:hypothetical protein